LKKLKLFETEMLKAGLFVLPGNRRFISIAHTEDDLAQTFDIVEQCCQRLRA
jgi:glutamate-1-semialdehyde aminotransferase